MARPRRARRPPSWGSARTRGAIEVSGECAGSNGWIHPVRERDTAPGMRERRGGWPRVARPVRQITAFNGKKRGSGVIVPRRGTRLARRPRRARASSSSRCCVPATAGRSRRGRWEARAREVWITRPGPGGTRKGGNKAAPPLNRLSALPSWPNLRATIGSPEARAWGF